MDKKNYTIITLSAILLVSLGFNIAPEPSHECDSREIQAYCFDLSSTGITCYTLPNYVGGKRCTEGWKDIDFKIEAKEWLCNSQGCVPK